MSERRLDAKQTAEELRHRAHVVLNTEPANARSASIRLCELAQSVARQLDALPASSQPVLDAEGPEIVASVEGVVAFMRSEREEPPADACVCCDGPHIFARGIDIEDEPGPGRERPHFRDYISRALFDNSLEGRRVRVSLEVLPGAALSDLEGRDGD